MLLKLFNMDHNNINIENMDLSPNNPIITKFFDNLMKDIQVDSMPTIIILIRNKTIIILQSIPF